MGTATGAVPPRLLPLELLSDAQSAAQRSETPRAAAEVVRGAQSILYTASSGIWRTVWLEPVPDRHVTSVDVVPDVDSSSLSMVVQGSDDAVGLDVKVAVSDKGKEVAASVGRVGRPFQVHLKFCLVFCLHAVEAACQAA